MVYSIFLRPDGNFDRERFCKWLESRPDTFLDPLGSGIYLVCSSAEVVAYVREKRINDPSGFPSCVLVTIKPEEINVFQEYGDDLELRIAREFVKTVVDETGCEVLDEYGTSWTDRVQREGVGVLYPPTLT